MEWLVVRGTTEEMSVFKDDLEATQSQPRPVWLKVGQFGGYGSFQRIQHG
jgi:hypothetical protein